MTQLWSLPPITLHDFRDNPDYRVQKELSRIFWAQPYYPLPSGILGVCAVCVVRGYNGWLYSPPEANHLIIPKNYTHDKEKTVNWWWNLVPVHNGCHNSLAHGKAMREKLTLALARLISDHYLEGPEDVREGMAWLRQQIELEELKVPVHLPLATF